MTAIVRRSLQQIASGAARRPDGPRLATATLRQMADPGSAPSRPVAERLDQPLSPWREPVRGGHPDPDQLALSGIEQLRRALADERLQAPLSRLTGLRLEEAGDGTATFRMPLTGWLVGASGTIPPGPLTIPADAAMACATMTQLPAWTPFTTSELTLRVLRPVAPEGSIWAQAKVIERGPPVALTEAILRDRTGALIAHGTSLCVTLPPVSPQPGPAGDTPRSGDPAGQGPDPWECKPPPGPAPDHGGPEALNGLKALQAEISGTRPPPPLHYFTGLKPTAASADEASFSLPASRWFCAPPPGRVQGGVVALLAEAALTGAVQTVTPAGTSFTPVELKCNFLRPLRSDGREAHARGRVIQSGRRIAVASAEVLDADGRQVAFASGSGLLGPRPR